MRKDDTPAEEVGARRAQEVPMHISRASWEELGSPIEEDAAKR